MTRFSRAYRLRKEQSQLDFVDVDLETDTPLFLDPFAISQRREPWAQVAHRTLREFFQQVIERIAAGDRANALRLLSHLNEPNETRLGFSSGSPKGAGIGPEQADQLYALLADSSAVRTGFISALEECELMVEGIGRDKISDLTTNIIRKHLIDYTATQCALHGIKTRSVPMAPYFDLDTLSWHSDYASVPVWKQRPILLVPKVVVRHDPAYDHKKYYNHFILEHLRAEHLNARSSLVHALKNGTRVVRKTDLKQQFPCSKKFLHDYSRLHPDVLSDYRRSVTATEGNRGRDDGFAEDEAMTSDALRKALLTIAPGPEAASLYHSMMIGAVELLFYPQLLHPEKEAEIHEGRKRIDILMENGASSGIFQRLHDIRKILCHFVAIECKNYTREIANPELDQIAGRPSRDRGMVGTICCRKFDDRSLFVKRCRDTFFDGRGLIIPLDDARITEMLRCVSEGRRASLDDLILQYVNEVSR